MLEQETRNIIQLGVGMCLIFFAFSSQGFIAETVLENRHKVDPKISKNAGYYSQTIVYGAFVISNIIAPPLVKLLTSKWSLVFGGVAYTIYEIGYQFINPYFLYASAAFEGLCAGVLWTAFGHYIAINSNSDNIARNSSIAWLLYASNLIFGGIFLWVMFGKEDTKEISMGLTRQLYGAFAGVTIVGNIIFAFLPSETKTKTDDVAFKTEEEAGLKTYILELRKSLELLYTYDFFLLIFISAYSGMELSFWSSVYSTCLSFTKRFNINTNVLMAMNSICIGVGEISGGIAFGMFGNRTNKYGRYPIVILGVVVALISYALAFINLPGASSYEITYEKGIIEPSIPIALVVGVMLGFTDACINTQTYSILTVLYDGRTRQAFALNKLFHAVLSTVCMFYGSVLELQWQLLILSIGAILTAITFYMAERRYIALKNDEQIEQKVIDYLPNQM